MLADLFLRCACLTWIGSTILIKLCTLRAIHLYIIIMITENNNDAVVTCHATKMIELWNYLFQILVTLLCCLFPSCYAPITAYFELLILCTVASIVYSYICVCFSFNQKVGLERPSLSCPRLGLLLACVFLVLEASRK